MKQNNSGLRRLLFATALASVACVALSTKSYADSEAGFIMVGGGESESGSVWGEGLPGQGDGSQSGGVQWGVTESGGPTDTGAESDSGGVSQSEAETMSGGASSAGSSSEATVGGTERNWGSYVQYYGK